MIGTRYACYIIILDTMVDAIIQDFAREYIRLSLLGVYQINEMAECTKVLPPAVKTYTEPDAGLVDKWRGSDQQFPLVADAIFNGSVVTPDLFSNVSVQV